MRYQNHHDKLVWSQSKLEGEKSDKISHAIGELVASKIYKINWKIRQHVIFVTQYTGLTITKFQYESNIKS